MDGVGETDGHDVTNIRAGAGFTRGLFVVQNGRAPAPASSQPQASTVGGYAYDGSTRFELVPWERIARAFSPPLEVDTNDFDPRRPYND